MWTWLAVHSCQIARCKRTRWSFRAVTVSRPSLFNVFVFLCFQLKFFNDLLVVNFHLGLAFSLFCVELANRKSVDWASHSLIFLYYSRLMDLLNKLRSHRGVFVVLVYSPFKGRRQRPSLLSNVLPTVRTAGGRASSHMPFLVAALTLPWYCYVWRAFVDSFLGSLVYRSLWNFSLKIDALAVADSGKRWLRVLQPVFRETWVVVLRWSSEDWISRTQRRVPLLSDSVRASRSLVCFMEDFVAWKSPLLNLSAKGAYRGSLHLLMIHIFVCRLRLAKLLFVITRVSSPSIYRLNSVELSRSTSHFWRSWMHVGWLCLARYFLDHHWINYRRVSSLLLLTYVMRGDYLIDLCNLWLIVELTR